MAEMGEINEAEYQREDREGLNTALATPRAGGGIDMLNKIFLMGRLVRDPELRVTNTGGKLGNAIRAMAEAVRKAVGG